MDPDRTLSTARVLSHPRQAVYQAFAVPDMLASWWGPEGFVNTFDAFDFQPGGRWIFTMQGPDGTRYANQSFFEALEPDRRIVIRHDCAPYFTLTVQLADTEGGTRLTWDQAFDTVETARAVEAVVGTANEQNLDRLTRALNSAALAPRAAS